MRLPHGKNLSVTGILPRFTYGGRVMRGLNSDEYFAIAAEYVNDRYVDLKLSEPVSFINKTDLLVKPDAARKQLWRERQLKSNPNHDEKENKEDTKPGNDKTPTPSRMPHHFSMRADLDYTRVNKQVNEYIVEIVQHLGDLEGSDVKLELNVEVDAPNGISSDVIRIVMENCKTEGIDDYRFDE